MSDWRDSADELVIEGPWTFRKAADLIEGAVLSLELTPADRAHLLGMCRRLIALAEAMEAPKVKPAPAAVPVPPDMPERLLTAGEAATRLGVHINTLANWRKRGLLVARVDGRGWHRYGAAELRRGLAILAGVPADELPTD